jgi:AcrR family transcriptional regulator
MSTTYRNEPVQDRAKARVASIISAAREVYNEVGQDYFNTNLVAEKAECSIGTVYRYFPDRVPLMDIIAPERNLASEKLAQIEAILKDSTEPNPRARIRAAVAVLDAPFKPTA